MAGGLSYTVRVNWNIDSTVIAPLALAFEKSMAATTVEAQSNLIRRLPGTSRNPTGKLRRSIRFGMKSRFWGQLRAGDGRNIKYAAAQEYGAKPHEIRARRKPNLSFPWDGSVNYSGPEGSASWVSTRLFVGPKVNHPGNKGLNYMTDAAEHFVEWFKVNTRMLIR